MLPVEILLATYNGARYLEQQLDSLLKQTYQDFSLLISDDGSTDRTLEILQAYKEKYPHKIILLPCGRRRGAQKNFSYLMACSTAPYVALCDQDDIWHPDKLFRSLNALLKLEKKHFDTPALIHTDLALINGENQLIHPSFWRSARINPKISRSLNRLLVQNAITGCTVLMNRALVKRVLPIPEGAIMHDWWLGMVAAAFGKVDFLEEPTIDYRQHAHNVVGAKSFWSIENLSRGVKKIFSANEKKVKQAEVFYERYFKDLSVSQKEVLENYLRIKEYHWLKNKYCCLKYRFLKSGFVRGSAVFLLQKQP